MSRYKYVYDHLHAILGVFGFIATVIAVQQGWVPLLVGKNDRFSCLQQLDTESGGQVWTVMYRNDKNEKPWLKMVSTLGGNWTPVERCNHIADRLETYREDGLTRLSYRPDSATPNQYVICAHTKLSGDDNCPLLITLKPGADPYATLQEMTAALHSGNGVYQNTDGNSTDTFSLMTPEINLENFLATEDK